MVEEGNDNKGEPTDNAKEGETSPTEEGETTRPKKMAIPAEVQARLGEPVSIEGMDANQIKETLKTLYERWVGAESEKYDVEYSVKVRDMQIHDLEMEVSDMRGKFIIPKLKKVHTFKLMDES
jgi:hypothetical protein